MLYSLITHIKMWEILKKNKEEKKCKWAKESSFFIIFFLNKLKRYVAEGGGYNCLLSRYTKLYWVPSICVCIK